MNHNPLLLLQRRAVLGEAGRGLGPLAPASLLNPAVSGAKDRASAASDRWPGIVHPPHVPPRAKRVIYLCMAGGPSHLETLDFKPKLAEMSGKPLPGSFTK